MTGYLEEDIMSSGDSEALKEINKNTSYKLSDLKGLTIRRKYDNITKNERPLL